MVIRAFFVENEVPSGIVSVMPFTLSSAAAWPSQVMRVSVAVSYTHLLLLFLRLQSLQSIWQFSAVVLPPSDQGFILSLIHICFVCPRVKKHFVASCVAAAEPKEVGGQKAPGRGVNETRHETLGNQED